ncbi:retrovirus-related pol polyprotein from transposon TNT 1-94 [Tanacetum coccineum]
MVTLRTLLAVAIHHDWIIEQLDVNNEFLYGGLHEEVYMQVPQGYSQTLPPNTICRLKKSLYGLKQANRQWFKKLTTFLKTLGFKQSIEFLRNKDSLALTQRKYAIDLVTYAGLLDTKPSATPLDPNKKLTPDNGAFLSNLSFYRALVGKLLYLTITRPDLAFATQALSQFLQQPRATHMKALLKVIKYVKLSMGQGLIFPARNNLHLIAYCDSDWASCPFTRRSVTDTTCKVTWIQCLLKEFQVNVPAPILMMYDNASSIALASNPFHHARSKHIKIDCHFVRDKVKA